MAVLVGEMDKGCITDVMRKILLDMVGKEAPKEAILSIINYIPRCEDIVKEEEKPHEKRKAAPEWGIKPVYVDEEGKREEYSSISALIRELGEKDPEMKMSGTICDLEGKKCHAASAVEILQIRGYKVDGDGEPRKASEGGEKLTIYHPSQEIVATKPKKKKPISSEKAMSSLVDNIEKQLDKLEKG